MLGLGIRNQTQRVHQIFMIMGAAGSDIAFRIQFAHQHMFLIQGVEFPVTVFCVIGYGAIDDSIVDHDQHVAHFFIIEFSQQRMRKLRPGFAFCERGLLNRTLHGGQENATPASLNEILQNRGIPCCSAGLQGVCVREFFGEDLAPAIPWEIRPDQWRGLERLGCVATGLRSAVPSGLKAASFPGAGCGVMNSFRFLVKEGTRLYRGRRPLRRLLIDGMGFFRRSGHRGRAVLRILKAESWGGILFSRMFCAWFHRFLVLRGGRRALHPQKSQEEEHGKKGEG